MSTALKWGILSTANIAQEKLIPALQCSRLNTVEAIASRNPSQAGEVARELGIPVAYGDYQQLLNAPDIDAIYNPLPNHLHVPWTIKAIEAGKHVLCEKPLGLDTNDAIRLVEAAEQHPNIKVMEAFMYRFHPQWQRAKQLLDDGEIGDITGISTSFTFFNRDPGNVRNKPGIGGGGLMDIGCYCISAARFLSGLEPLRVSSTLTLDADFDVDKHAYALLDFGRFTARIFCSTQSEPSQRVEVMGEKGRMVLDYPFYQPGCPASITLYHDLQSQTTRFDTCDHYVLQVDAFADAIVNDLPVPTPLSDAVSNMKVIDAVFDASKKGSWVLID